MPSNSPCWLNKGAPLWLPLPADTGGLVKMALSKWYSQLPEKARWLTSCVMLTSLSSPRVLAPVAAISGSPFLTPFRLPSGTGLTPRKGSSGLTSPKPVAMS